MQSMRKAGKISNIRLLYHSLSEEIIANNLFDLKFLCGDYLTPVRLEKIDNAKQLLSAIGEVVESESEQLELLKELFEKIGRRDLKSKVEEFQQSRKAALEANDCHLEELNVNAPTPLFATYDRPETSLQSRESLFQPGTSGRKPEPSFIHRSYDSPLETGSGSYSTAEPSSQAAVEANDCHLGELNINTPPPLSATYDRLETSSQSRESLFQPGTSGRKPEPSLINQHHDSPLETGSGSYSRAEPSSQDTCAFAENSAEDKFGQEVTEDVGNCSHKPWGHAPTDSHEPEDSLNGIVESRDQPDRGNPVTPSRRSAETCGSTTTTSSTFVESQEKVPVENCTATDLSDTTNLKCPVEMSYMCIKEYFGIGTKELGKGGFGVVYEGTRKYNGQDVVIKEEDSTHIGQSHSTKQLRREKRVGYVKHPHLMPLYAFSEEKGKPCCLMYPKMHSDLRTALLRDKHGQEKLSWENRVRIALHTARALQYLHTGVKTERNIRQEIVHMDVKPGNIFLDEEFNARLGDAGMSQELPTDHSYASISQMRGTEGYSDVHCHDLRLKPINDIFSFGVVMLELLTQRKAVEKTGPLHHVLKKEGVLSDPERLMTKAKKNVWPGKADDSSVTKEFAAIAIDCLKPPSERASIHNISKRLEAILERERIHKVAKPKEGVSRCASCLLNPPAKYLTVRSSGCDSVRFEGCNYFCVTCLTQAQRNPLECPSHGPAEPLIGGSDIYAVLVCGNDSKDKINAAVFDRDLYEFKNVLEDCRIIGVRRDHIYCVKPHSSCQLSQATEVKQALAKLKQDLQQQGKRDVFLYFYFTGHSDKSQNLICSSYDDVLTVSDLKDQFTHLKGLVGEFLIILDCCFADGNIVSDDITNEAYFVHKSPVQKDKQDPLKRLSVDLYRLLDDREDFEDIKTPNPKEAEQDTLDGNVILKAPSKAKVTVRQWSSSLSEQSSYGKRKGNSFLTQYLVRGLRGAHSKCPLTKSSCSWCEKFRAQARSVGYITAANLEAYISKHVDEQLQGLSGEKRQTPCMRSLLHSNETVLAYYSEDILQDEVIFKCPFGRIEGIVVDQFPFTLLEFQKQLFSITKVKDNLPNCAEPKHLQILCDGDEITSDSYVDLMDFIRQGYDVRCQLRPHSSIVHGPVMLEIHDSRELVVTLLELLLQPASCSQDMTTFKLDTNQTTYDAEDFKFKLEDEPTVTNFTETPLGKFISEMILTVSSSPSCGILNVHVRSSSLDCSFKTSD